MPLIEIFIKSHSTIPIAICFYKYLQKFFLTNFIKAMPFCGKQNKTQHTRNRNLSTVCSHVKQGQLSHLICSLALHKEDCTRTGYVPCQETLDMKAWILFEKHSVEWFILLAWIKIEVREGKKWCMQKKKDDKVYFWCIL